MCPQATHELEPELILSKVLERYGDFPSGFTKDYATMNRDMVLEAISDSGTVAPLIMTANLHSRANPKSYMYVFSYPKAMQDYSGVSRSLNDTTKIDYRGSDAPLDKTRTRDEKNVARRVNGQRKGCEECGRKNYRERREEQIQMNTRMQARWTSDELKCASFNAPVRAVSCDVVPPSLLTPFSIP